MVKIILDCCFVFILGQGFFVDIGDIQREFWFFKDYKLVLEGEKKKKLGIMLCLQLIMEENVKQKGKSEYVGGYRIFKIYIVRYSYQQVRNYFFKEYGDFVIF